VFDLKDLKDLPTPKEIEEMGQALADRSNVVIEDDTADETRESQLELDFEESETGEPTGLADNPDNGADPPGSDEGVEPTDPEADSGYPRPS
jgi:heme-binding NEAT domain protein